MLAVAVAVISKLSVLNQDPFQSSETLRTSPCTTSVCKQSIGWAAQTTQKSSTSTSKRLVSAISPKLSANEAIFAAAAVTDFASPRFLQTETKKEHSVSGARTNKNSRSEICFLISLLLPLWVGFKAWISQNWANFMRTVSERTLLKFQYMFLVGKPRNNGPRQTVK